VEEFGARQAERYYEALVRRFGEIAEHLINIRQLITSGQVIGVVSAVWTASTIE
jgi:hypothetical protein